jgi:hypothetical protein
MPTQAENANIPNHDNAKPAENSEKKRLDRAANEAAEKAGKTEQRYDQGHNIFTK